MVLGEAEELKPDAFRQLLLARTHSLSNQINKKALRGK